MDSAEAIRVAEEDSNDPFHPGHITKIRGLGRSASFRLVQQYPGAIA
jgi:hypothetical protein